MSKGEKYLGVSIVYKECSQEARLTPVIVIPQSRWPMIEGQVNVIEMNHHARLKTRENFQDEVVYVSARPYGVTGVYKEEVIVDQ